MWTVHFDAKNAAFSSSVRKVGFYLDASSVLIFAWPGYFSGNCVALHQPAAATNFRGRLGGCHILGGRPQPGPECIGLSVLGDEDRRGQKDYDISVDA